MCSAWRQALSTAQYSGAVASTFRLPCVRLPPNPPPTPPTHLEPVDDEAPQPVPHLGAGAGQRLGRVGILQAGRQAGGWAGRQHITTHALQNSGNTAGGAVRGGYSSWPHCPGQPKPALWCRRWGRHPPTHSPSHPPTSASSPCSAILSFRSSSTSRIASSAAHTCFCGQAHRQEGGLHSQAASQP